MGEVGTVISELGENVKVSMIRTEACAKCKACTVGMASQEMIIEAKNICGAKIGEKVNIELDGGSFLMATMIMYGIPLVMLLFGFIAGEYIQKWLLSQSNEIISFIIGFLAMALTYFIISKNEKSFKNKKYEPVATEIV